MPRVMRRTPESEEAASYGYVDFLKDIIRKTAAAEVSSGKKTVRGITRLPNYLVGNIPGTTIAGLRETLGALSKVMYTGKAEEHPREVLDLAMMGLVGGVPGAPRPAPGSVSVGMSTKWKMPITRPHLASVVPDEAARIVKKYKSQGLTYDAFVNQIPDKPEFAYHQWTFRGKGPLARATVTTRGTSLDEFEEMVADRIRKFAKEKAKDLPLKPEVVYNKTLRSSMSREDYAEWLEHFEKVEFPKTVKAAEKHRAELSQRLGLLANKKIEFIHKLKHNYNKTLKEAKDIADDLYEGRISIDDVRAMLAKSVNKKFKALPMP